MQSGLSLADLSRLVHYSKSHLSKVENGLKPPSIDLARRCDAAIGCDGALAGLAPRPVVDVDIQPDTDVGEVWVLTLGAEGDSGFRSVSRRELITGGVAGSPPGRGCRTPCRVRTRPPRESSPRSGPSSTNCAPSASRSPRPR